MKNTVKKLLAVVLAAALCLSLTACYSENNTWIAKDEDETLPIGAYLYYISSSYVEARDQVSSDQEVLKADIDGKDGKTWVQDRAVNYVSAYFYLKDRLKALDQSLTQEELDQAAATTDSMWSYYRTTFEEIGIAKESFHKAYSVYNEAYEKYFKLLYGEGGEKEVSQDELKAYFSDNYLDYDYFYVSLSKTDDDGNSTDLSDEEKQELKTKLDGYITKINAGSMDLEEAAKAYAADALGGEENSTYYEGAPSRKESMSDAMVSGLESVDEGQAAVVETSTGYYVSRRLPIAEAFEEVTADADQKTTVLQYMKNEEYEAYLLEQAAQHAPQINTGAQGLVDWSKIVNDTNKNGAKTEDSTDGE